ncbi:hypothetical protein L210DRAFT_3639325 [Boletus edulis BED1]|uniref:Uncharacterized protein n=1 Tax=Boletus edulis BED1 TaxID=1328754 RepID=A0AAD4CA22_BOLED|nr:hypothetical protein L210DRAFT_3639325 [Boletus edulis BED1]
MLLQFSSSTAFRVKTATSSQLTSSDNELASGPGKYLEALARCARVCQLHFCCVAGILQKKPHSRPSLRTSGIHLSIDDQAIHFDADAPASPASSHQTVTALIKHLFLSDLIRVFIPSFATKMVRSTLPPSSSTKTRGRARSYMNTLHVEHNFKHPLTALSSHSPLSGTIVGYIANALASSSTSPNSKGSQLNSNVSARVRMETAQRPLRARVLA